jgi:hypothetical protein
MIFDTQTDQVVGNQVYDVKTEPKTGQVGKFETYSAEYVGTKQEYGRGATGYSEGSERFRRVPRPARR